MNERWRKSTRSGTQGNCVEVREIARIIEVRDSKDRSGPTLRIEPAAWTAFTQWCSTTS